MLYNYSVIIPYRDTLHLLHKAVCSIPDRKDIQIIIVDNSKRNLECENIPTKVNATVLYLTSDSSKGAGCARNFGLKNAKGSHILFLDADDYFTPTAFDSFDKYLDCNFDIVFFKADSIRLKDGSQSNRHYKISALIDDYLLSHNEDSLRYLFPNPCCKLFLADFVFRNDFVFDEVRVSNDVMFSLRTGHFASKITADEHVVYMITEGEKNSSLTKKRSAENQFIRYKVNVEKYLFVVSVGRPDMRYELLSYVVHALVDFGPSEFLKYIKYARQKRVNIFYGFKLKKILKGL